MNVIGYPYIRNLITIKLSRASSFQYGELVLAIDRRNRTKLFKLKEHGELEGRMGKIYHNVIAGHEPSDSFKTNEGQYLTLKRPSLEEFVLLTRRRANIMYPKDAWALIGMMDIGPGSKVMEAGGGSGSLTLHLSRAVGSSGRVISFEKRKDHLDNAMANCTEWDNCLRYRGDNGLIDNIEFHNRDINDAIDIISDKVDAVGLDLVDPTLVLETVSALIKPMGVIVVYLPNISQAIDLSRHISSGCLPLSWVAVQEVIHRQWSIYPASHKKGIMTRGSMLVTSIDSNHPTRGYVEPQSGNDDIPTALKQHFIARPSHTQAPHSGFLVKLRKS